MGLGEITERERSCINNGHIVPEGKTLLITRHWNLQPRYNPLINDWVVDTCQSDVKIKTENGWHFLSSIWWSFSNGIFLKWASSSNYYSRYTQAWVNDYLCFLQKESLNMSETEMGDWSVYSHRLPLFRIMIFPLTNQYIYRYIVDRQLTSTWCNLTMFPKHPVTIQYVVRSNCTVCGFWVRKKFLDAY